MNIMEKLTGAAKNRSKKKMIIAGAVIFIACAGGILYFSVQGKGLFKSFSAGGNKQNQQAAVQQNSSIKKPDRNADLTGLVESVNGNEVKILLLDSSKMPQMNGGSNSGGQRPTGNSGDQSGANAQQGQNSGSGQGQPQGMQDGNSDEAKTARTAMIAELKKSSTGEVTIIVPVGIQMVKMGGFQGGMQGNSQNASNNSDNNQNSQNGQNNQTGSRDNTPGGGEVEASFSDLKADTMVSVWLNQTVTDRKVAEFVSIGR